MNSTIQTSYKYDVNIKMSQQEFRKFSKLITGISGIKLPDSKKLMLEARLKKRLRHLEFESFEEYSDYIFNDGGLKDELVPLLNVVTTNKTDFFREPTHFEFLAKQVLPELLSRNKRKINIWSAGCSTGEELYTLAIVLEEFLESYGRFDYSILGTDISTHVLDKAKKAIYKEELIEVIPNYLKKKYFLRSKDRVIKQVRPVADIRKNIKFGMLNLLDKEYNIREKMDIIFCRNVFIYFEKDIQQKIVKQFYRYSAPNSFLFIGHSENLHGLDVPYKQIAPTIYQRV